MTFKRRSRYSPTSSQGRVLIKQASVLAYLTRFAVKFFSYDSLNARKQKKIPTSYVQGQLFNISSTENFFWFTSSGFLKRPVSLKYWLLRPYCLQGSHMQEQYHKRITLPSESSTIKGLLYAPDPEKCKKGMLSDQPRLSRVTSTALLCCWGRSCSKIWRPAGLTLRCMPYGRGTLWIPLQRIS